MHYNHEVFMGRKLLQNCIFGNHAGIVQIVMRPCHVSMLLVVNPVERKSYRNTIGKVGLFITVSLN